MQDVQSLYQNAIDDNADDLSEIMEITRQIRESVNQYTLETIFTNRENLKTHNPYDQEERMLYSIESGNVDLLMASLKEVDPSTLGTTAKDPVRNAKNTTQYVIFAASRAAIRGGLPAEFALTLTDAYSQKIEELKDLSILGALVESILVNLTEMVHQVKMAFVSAKESSDANPIIERCKNYVFNHLHEKLTVQDIASVLGIHPNALSNLFTKCEGVSLLQYILIQKIELVKNMLIYSDYSYIEIANYLGFSSQSHLGSQFKKVTGMTLKQFRDKYQKEEFLP